jgi:hypothetical protein
MMCANDAERKIRDEVEDSGDHVHISNLYLRYSDPVRQPMLSMLYGEYHGHAQIAREGAGEM